MAGVLSAWIGASTPFGRPVIGRVAVPSALSEFPALRAGGGGQPWMEYRRGNLDGLGPITTDRDLPISTIVNHEALKEMLVSDRRPADRW